MKNLTKVLVISLVYAVLVVTSAIIPFMLGYVFGWLMLLFFKDLILNLLTMGASEFCTLSGLVFTVLTLKSLTENPDLGGEKVGR